MTRQRLLKPPIVLDGCRVEQYAVRPRSLKFTGHGLQFRGDKEIGPVPRLALGRHQNGEVFLLHCDARWNVKGAAAYPTLRAAKQRAERFYTGISREWVRTGYTRKQARRFLARTGTPQKCSICATPWFEVDRLVEIKKAKSVICSVCIHKLHAVVSDRSKPVAG